jgi:hypothetical protein
MKEEEKEKGMVSTPNVASIYKFGENKFRNVPKDKDGYKSLFFKIEEEKDLSLSVECGYPAVHIHNNGVHLAVYPKAECYDADYSIRGTKLSEGTVINFNPDEGYKPIITKTEHSNEYQITFERDY